jgi:S1-C subfamily serine protease
VIGKVFKALAAALTVALAGPASAQSVETAESAIVRVAVILDSLEGRMLAGAGSGFVVAPNLIVTNAHVVAQARAQPQYQIAVIAQQDETLFSARIIAYSPLSELALLELRAGPELTPVTISSVEPHAGDAVIALGYPDVDFQGASSADLLRPTAPSRTSGEIASLRDRAPTGDRLPTINHQAVISSGSSGGPLLDECGRVIGVNSWHVRGAETRETRSVATRVEQLIEFLRQAGVTPIITDQRCLSGAERAEAERAATLQALQDQNAELAEKLDTADRLTRIAIVVLVAGTLALFVSVCVLGAVLLGRRREVAPAEHFDAPRRRGSVATIVAGAALAAIVILVAGLLLMRAQRQNNPPAAPSAAVETLQGG